MIKTILRTFFALLILSCFADCVKAANTYDWVGGGAGGATAWTNPINWKLNTVTQSAGGSYPGQLATTDIVNFGVVSNYTTNQPTLSASLPNPIASIEFGGNNANPIKFTCGSFSYRFYTTRS